LADVAPPSVVRLANDVAANLAHRPDALEAVAGHLQRYWDPRMRQTLRAWVSQGGQGLSPLALAAQQRLVDL
jgi:formate dehydrogenase subunit delta